MKSEARDGMSIDWDAPIAMDDGVVLRADVFRPSGDGRHPVILSYGPYAKGLAFQDGYKGNWARLINAAPEVLTGSSNKYQVWELVDPEKWVPDGYACVRVDSRGAGRSPGYIDIWSPREAQDLYQCIEWAGTQPWSNGKVGMNGISYFATNQWQVAALRPPHLAALCIWEGFADYYRELARHGGILSDFIDRWYARQVLNVQHGVGDKGARSKVTGEAVAGPETLAPQELAKNRADPGGEAARRHLVDDYYGARMVDFEKIEVPLLSAANWGGQGLHPRGNFEGYLRAGSGQKWLEVHGDTHFTHFYSNYGIGLQKRFFGHFLKGENDGLGAPAACCVEHPPARREIRATRRKRVAARAHPLDQILPRPGGARACDGSANGRGDAHLRSHGRRPHLPDAADDRRVGDHRPGCRENLAFVRDPRRGRIPRAACVRPGQR